MADAAGIEVAPQTTGPGEGKWSDTFTASEANPADPESFGAEWEQEQEVKQRQKIIRVDKVYTESSLHRKARKFRFVKTAKPRDDKKKFGRYVLTVARCISAQGVFTGEYQVDIRGKYISDILNNIYKDAEGVSFSRAISMNQEELKYLFYALPQLHARLLEARSPADRDPELIFELEAVLEFTQQHFANPIVELSELPQFQITFEHLWTLFPPNTLAFGQDVLNQPRVYRVKRSTYAKDPSDGSLYYGVEFEYLDSDGEYTGRVCPRTPLRIGSFAGAMPVQRLSLFPLVLHPDYSGELRGKLVLRGERLLALHGQRLQEYKGHAIGDDDGKKFNSHGRVMLDPQTMAQLRPLSQLIPSISVPMSVEKLTDDDKMMLNPVLYGFSLGDKTWGAFAVAGLRTVEWNETIIDSLVLDKARKKFIRSLVKTHGLRPDGEGFDDFVRDKGRGLIGLLSGPPGVGKTLTAEAVAEISRRPLYAVSSGELGESASSVEKGLASVLELAETWRAVVLLDEADVFLAQRGTDNLAQNAVTSIFLRHLEYYQGILLLTTNRLASFDPAFQSRIHFWFEYGNLDEQARLCVWQKFAARARAAPNVEVALSQKDLEELAKLDLNGRQIKNCMGISQAVTAEKKEPLDLACVRLAVSFVNVSCMAGGLGQGGGAPPVDNGYDLLLL
ncbi:P-loop containing nucleoside triphosphate hydrolase [Staphylotrichum tortipilum]|uniref:P-loop containing nucleoside triphosphate hydrolase n=1 Tax=Staphylotrichum tortipilum TaxID=2831512 RepID=A0AAN6MIY5_9PEZI|nr:P-loop containing nucleoside triphosphate hydrolase [Staphylotrichum longicolle]